MDLEDLRTFVEVADAGGVAPAARRLGLAKSIVSRRLTRLEEALGAQLLSRTTRGSALTEAGAAFREHAMRVVAELEAAQETLSPEGEVRGLLRIAAPLSFGITRLPPIFAELARRHPLLHLDTSYSDRFVDLVGEGFDCAIRLGMLRDSSLIVRRIRAFRARLVASPGYIAAHGTPQTLTDLAHHQAVTRKGEVWPILDGDNTVTVRPRGRFTADNGEAVLAAALAGVGVAALPDFLTETHIAAGSLVPLLERYTTPELGMFVVRPPGAFPSRKVRVLIDILLEYFGEAAGRKSG
ncbi:LysR family transcriptional regulator [Mesorhizobium sp.]|uniref:LysR family transcriptional regulator n=1 Tax=Mesorhizobium sp. TaxID=1871066 RepID=UPI000FE73EEB|nr:LysR family transcriptional regulator [Mesorhizobium sp.]RWK44636.1 MAG: LysR family transcriptional regulator [Mesorhizobium sp.]RWK69026.1 MAG: LysR family transcriptional regulator [Mesorhizobium sp.]RWK78658.1 MAG: LysR family transcriptional regulator [Mesorhizobium sp.]RWK81820.1 MAG: LysR family transcriptional regulator [Mesorhizobium sp.]RWL09337.1 MAG: LysR family transcriptional regulator [Mesorhizobium sp.]